MDAEEFVAERVKPIESSGIRRVFELGASLPDPINLSIGQPDFNVPEAAKRAMIDAIQADRTGYTVTRGIPELRGRIAEQLRGEFEWDPDVMVTSGVSGGLFLALLACVNPTDEIVFGDPYFVSYLHLVRLVGGTPVPVDLYDSFRLDPDRIAAAISPKTKILLLASPGNPTGIVHRPEDVQAVANLARRHNLLILSDEIYCALSYDGMPASPVSYAPERTVLLRGFGKSHAMTGLRLGYAAGPERIIAEMEKLQQYTFVCAPHPAQFGALAAMDTDMSSCIDAYRAKRDLVCRELDGAFEYARPSGGFYVFPKIPPGFDSATVFAEQAAPLNLLIIPGSVFSKRDTHFRISYAVPDAKIRAGCAILRTMARQHTGR